MDLKIARFQYPITVLGPGRRVGIWFQGCTIGCSGCMSKDTWDSNAGEQIDVKFLCDLVVAAAKDENLDGITISGGEPFQQPEALLELCVELKRALPTADILVYSGLSMGILRRKHLAVLKVIDAVIAEPFVASRPTELPWQGSSNQRLELLSTRGKERYSNSASEHNARLQVSVDEEGVWVAGIPRRGDLDRMRTRLLEKGLNLEEVSWMT
jgi:anaerobic ribonucleoside-triphosphate reductase activating protein